MPERKKEKNENKGGEGRIAGLPPNKRFFNVTSLTLDLLQGSVRRMIVVSLSIAPPL